jgi:probable DNA metabolism protein
MQINYVTDGTLNGLLSALFISFVSKEKPIKVFGEGVFQPILGVKNIKIRTADEQAERVSKALSNYGGEEILTRLRVCMASCEEDALTVAFYFAYATLEGRKNVINNLSDKRVTDFIFIEQRVLVEKHHVKGFLRF